MDPSSIFSIFSYYKTKVLNGAFRLPPFLLEMVIEPCCSHECDGLLSSGCPSNPLEDVFTFLRSLALICHKHWLPSALKTIKMLFIIYSSALFNSSWLSNLITFKVHPPSTWPWEDQLFSSKVLTLNMTNTLN